jgi:hypothetical protein
MMCWFEESDFRPAWLAIQKVKTGDFLDNWEHYPEWFTAVLRVTADNGTLTLEGPYGNASIPAEVEQRGVLYLPIRDFVDTMARTWGETRLMLKADNRKVRSNHAGFLLSEWQFEVFDDPAAAPATWEFYENPDEADSSDEEPAASADSAE